MHGSESTFIAMRTPQDVDRMVRPGLTIGNYLVCEPVGMGGMGMVFRGQNLADSRTVALKFLICDPNNAEKRLQQITNEAGIVSMLRHESIVDVYEVCQVDGFTFLVMDLFLGPQARAVNLMDYAKSFGPATGVLEQDDLQQIMLALLDAVGYAHEHGVVHCDLKPENILFACKESQGDYWMAELKLTDFGVARIIGEDLVLESVTKSLEIVSVSDDVTQDVQALVGTYEYMSPEQRRGQPATPVSDLYAVGLIVLRLLTGRVQLGPGIRPSQTRKGLSSDWDHVIFQALEENPQARYQSAHSFAAAIDRITL